MTSSVLFTWVTQTVVTCLLIRDLSPGGKRFVARALGVQSDYWICVWLIGLTTISLFMGSRIAANAFAAYTGKRPHEDWRSYSQSGVVHACYWCGLTSFAASLVLSRLILPSIALPSLKVGEICGLSLLVNAILIRIVVHAVLLRRYGRSTKGRPRNQQTGAAFR